MSFRCCKAVNYIPVENIWCFKLAKRLKAVGYEVNTDVLLYFKKIQCQSPRSYFLIYC